MTGRPALDELHASTDWRTVDVISDLHLRPEEPATFDAWARYLAAPGADAVFILGDLFEVWVGDDAAQPGTFEARCGRVLAACPVPVFFLRGNRDFLVGSDFLARCGVRDLPADPTLLLWAGQRVLLSHGDLLCTDDTAYQQFRAQVRSAEWQRAFATQPLAQRQALARQMRAQSQAHQAGQTEYGHTDAALARRWLLDAGATLLIHGHTHRPADHALGADAQGRALTQVVLSDWHIDAGARRAQLLRLHADGQRQRIDL